jgi:hypothetical protein
MKVTRIVSCVFIIIVISGCEEPPQHIQEIGYTPPVETRSFYMGMTPHPHDYTAEGVKEAYKILDRHTDIICHHFDEGIPWPEAYGGRPYHPNVENELNNRVNRLKKGHEVYVAVAPLSSDRYTLAGYWSDKTGMERPATWKNKDFDDQEVITAYTNFCQDLIDRFDPDYFNYGVEVNDTWKSVNDPNFTEFLYFAESVYTALKKEYPGLPVFVSFIKNSKDLDETQVTINKKILHFSDYMAVSTYPFWDSAYGPDVADPADLPEDWFSSMAALAPDKPFAVAETGYIAEDLIIEEYNCHIQGREDLQEEYVKFLLESAHELDAEFVIWFVPRDYDQGYERIKTWGLPPWIKIWRDCGLIDGEGNLRMSLTIWDAWLHLYATP